MALMPEDVELLPAASSDFLSFPFPERLGAGDGTGSSSSTSSSPSPSPSPSASAGSSFLTTLPPEKSAGVLVSRSPSC